MIFPTFSGALSAPIDALALADTDPSTITPQQAADYFWGGLGYGYVASSIRSNMLTSKVLGAGAAQKVQENKILTVF